MVSERAVHVEIPAARVVRRRHAHVPRAREVSEGPLHRLADRGQQCGVGDVAHVNVDGVDYEHIVKCCKGDTAVMRRITDGRRREALRMAKKSLLRKTLLS